MRHELGDGKEENKEHKKVVGQRISGSENHGPAIDPELYEIDPADFIDPEEFGYRRGSFNGR
jgi:hypothetical protein